MSRMMRPVNRIGPRKLKSLPFLEAQKVYPVKAHTTAEVRIRASSTILPANMAVGETCTSSRTKRTEILCYCTVFCP